MNRAPNSAPPTVPSPPITIAARKVNDSARLNDSGATNPTVSANSAPATPAYAALQANTRLFTRARSTPMVVAARSFSRMATSARPSPPRVRLAASRNIGTATTSTSRYRNWSGSTGSQPGAAGCGTLMPCTPPVSPSKRLISGGVAIASARVTSARYSPRSRSAGTPKAKPSAKASSAAAGTANGYGRCALATRMAAVYAPIAKKAPCPSEICPA
jgi:hypothetical protein